MPPADPPLPAPGPRVAREKLRSGGHVRFAEGAPDAVIDRGRVETLLDELIGGLGRLDRVLLVPPDFTRFHSGAGELTSLLYARLSARANVEVLPALGTHAPMTPADIQTMFPGIPLDRFFVHEWRSGLSVLGEVPAEFVSEVSG